MKALTTTIFLFLAILSSPIFLFSQNCNHSIEASVFVVDGEQALINPGDVVCLEAGNKDFLLIQNVHGTASNPVTFVNHGGKVVIDTDHFYGIKTDNCSFIKILGNGDSNEVYGIQVKRVANGAGISIDDLSTDVEVAHLEVANTLIAGLYAKTDPDCSFASSRDNFTLTNLSIHDCYFHHIGDEGFYIGHSKYEDGVYLADCDTTIYPHLLKGVDIYNNVLEHVGWDGIQVASADEDCAIHDNIIRYDSEKETVWQMSGILIGGGSRCDCYNNQIFDGKGDGIDVLGLGDFKVFNNLIVRAGKEFEPSNPDADKHGIYVGDVVTISGSEFKLYNNTIVSPKSYGITYNNSIASKSYFYSNFVIDPGKKHLGEQAFINNLIGPEKVELGNNVYVNETDQANFKNPANDNYDLTEYSPSINLGKNLSSEGITFDLLNRIRPYDTYYDAGAFEWQGPDGFPEITDNSLVIKNIYPNPADNLCTFDISVSDSQTVSYSLISPQGKILMTDKEYCEIDSKNRIEIVLENYPTGIYLILIETKHGSLRQKLIIGR